MPDEFEDGTFSLIQVAGLIRSSEPSRQDHGQRLRLLPDRRGMEPHGHQFGQIQL